MTPCSNTATDAFEYIFACSDKEIVERQSIVERKSLTRHDISPLVSLINFDKNYARGAHLRGIFRTLVRHVMRRFFKI